MKKAIVMDIDQVLLDYASGVREYVNTRDGKSIEGQNMIWDLSHWLEIPPGTSLDLIKEFAQHWRFGVLDALPGADVILHQLMREDYALVCLTACGDSDMTINLRLANLYHRFGDIFDEVHFVNPEDSKSDKLKDIDSRYDIVAFVDDKPANLEDAKEVGIENVVMMKAVHNRPYRNQYPSMFSWYEVKKYIDRQG